MGVVVDIRSAHRRLRPEPPDPPLETAPPKGWWLNAPFLVSFTATCALFLFAGAAISTVAWHSLAPADWHWVSAERLSDLHTLIFGAAAVACAWLCFASRRPPPPRAPKPRRRRVRTPARSSLRKAA